MDDRFRKGISLLNDIARQELGRGPRPEVRDGFWGCGCPGTTRTLRELRAMRLRPCPKHKEV